MSEGGSGHTGELEWLPSRLHTRPLEPFVDDEIHDAAILLLQIIRKLSIPSELTRHTVELVDPIVL